MEKSLGNVQSCPWIVIQWPNSIQLFFNHYFHGLKYFNFAIVDPWILKKILQFWNLCVIFFHFGYNNHWTWLYIGKYFCIIFCEYLFVTYQSIFKFVYHTWHKNNLMKVILKSILFKINTYLCLNSSSDITVHEYILSNCVCFSKLSHLLSSKDHLTIVFSLVNFSIYVKCMVISFVIFLLFTYLLLSIIASTLVFLRYTG